jgi:hypothetical protein
MSIARTGMILLLLACSSAQASDWKRVATGKNTNAVEFVDVSSIRIDGNIRRAWVKVIYSPHTQSTDGDQRWWKEARAKEAFNCRDETSSDEAITVYFEDGGNTSPTGIYPTPWKPVTPDTVQYGVMAFICAWKP